MGDVFKGVYCIDEVNAKPIEISAAYVFNSEARRRPQGHWFAIYTNIQGVTFYFDIFETPPHLPEIIEFFYSRATSCLYSATPLTSNHSEVSGYYCICFLLQIAQLDLIESIKIDGIL